MTEIQEFFTRLVYNISLIIPLGYAFGAGMVSTVNPCGFAMLPAYLGCTWEVETSPQLFLLEQLTPTAQPRQFRSRHS